MNHKLCPQGTESQRVTDARNRMSEAEDAFDDADNRYRTVKTARTLQLIDDDPTLPFEYAEVIAKGDPAVIEANHARHMAEIERTLAKADMAAVGEMATEEFLKSEPFKEFRATIRASVALRRRRTGPRRVNAPRGASRESRPGTTRTQGSRRSGTGTSGSSSDPGEGGDSDPPGPRAVTGWDQNGPKCCQGCGAPIDPARRADAKWCPPPRTSACRRLAAKGEGKPPTPVAVTAAPADFKPQPSQFTYGEKQCRASGWHPEHVAEVAKRVRATRTPQAAARVLAEWLARCSHDLVTGELTCATCGRPVAERTLGPPFPTELGQEMMTDSLGRMPGVSAETRVLVVG